MSPSGTTSTDAPCRIPTKVTYAKCVNRRSVKFRDDAGIFAAVSVEHDTRLQTVEKTELNTTTALHAEWKGTCRQTDLCAKTDYFKYLYYYINSVQLFRLHY